MQRKAWSWQFTSQDTLVGTPGEWTGSAAEDQCVGTDRAVAQHPLVVGYHGAHL